MAADMGVTASGWDNKFIRSIIIPRRFRAALDRSKACGHAFEHGAHVLYVPLARHALLFACLQAQLKCLHELARTLVGLW